jgi:hypothetical protein
MNDWTLTRAAGAWGEDHEGAWVWQKARPADAAPPSRAQPVDAEPPAKAQPVDAEGTDVPQPADDAGPRSAQRDTRTSSWKTWALPLAPLSWPPRRMG